MPNFEWILRNWAELNDSFENSKTISLRDFLTRSGLEEDSDWLSLAQAWGREQSPMILIDPHARDPRIVVLHKHW